MTRAVASFSSPSASRMVTIRRGIPMRPATATAATGSGGATIAPSTIATAHGSPSAAWASSATALVVATTSPTASIEIGRRSRRRSRRLVCRAAQYSSGGRNSASVSSGSSSTSGSPGTRATARPAAISSTGSGTRVCPARVTTTAMAASMPMSSSRVSMTRDQDHPNEQEWTGGTVPVVDDATFHLVLAEAIRVAEATGLPHAFMGGIASTALGRPRWTHDVDLLVRPGDAQAMLRAFAAAGFDAEETDQAWLYKATRDGVLVDVIFESTGGIVLDDEMLSRVRAASFDGLRLSVLAPEDLLVIKAIVHREHRQRHWFDALALVETGELDWPYLLRRAEPNPRRVASLLLYAQTEGLEVPDWVVEELLAKAREQEGTDDEPDEYLIARAQDALVRDPRTGELELDVAVDGDVVVLSGAVATPERQAAVAEVVAKALPGREVRNLTSADGPAAAPFVETLP